LMPISAPQRVLMHFLSTRVFHSYLNFTESGNRTYVHSVLKINTFFQRLYTGRMHLDSIQYTYTARRRWSASHESWNTRQITEGHTEL
jgi:hypothetical protein